MNIDEFGNLCKVGNTNLEAPPPDLRSTLLAIAASLDDALTSSTRGVTRTHILNAHEEIAAALKDMDTLVAQPNEVKG